MTHASVGGHRERRRTPIGLLFDLLFLRIHSTVDHGFFPNNSYGALACASVATTRALAERELLLVLLKPRVDHLVIHLGVHVRGILERPKLHDLCSYGREEPRIPLEVPGRGRIHINERVCCQRGSQGGAGCEAARSEERSPGGIRC